MFAYADAELPGGWHQRGLSRSVSHPSHQALFANSRDHGQRDSRLLSSVRYLLVLVAELSRPLVTYFHSTISLLHNIHIICLTHNVVGLSVKCTLVLKLSINVKVMKFSCVQWAWWYIRYNTIF